MDQGARSGSHRYAISIAILVVTLALLGCGALTLLPRSGETSANQIKSLKELALAYARIEPGRTPASQLARLGFDTTTSNVQVLSYLGVMERYMTGASTNFDRLAAPLQSCIEARDRCTAFVFKPGEQSRGSMFASFGFGANAAGRDAEVTLLVQNGRVAYKAISGMPQAPAPRRVASPVLPRAVPAAVPVAYRSLY